MNIKKYIWIILGLIALVINWLFGLFPSFYEVFYYNGIFQIIRTVYDFTLGWIPFPMVYILFFVVVQIIYQFLKFKGFRSAEGAIAKIWSVIFPIISLAGAVIFFFYFLWGFNYQQQNLSEQLDLPEVTADTTELFNEAIFFLDKLELLRTEISNDTLPLSFDQLTDELEVEIRQNLEEILSNWDLPTAGRVRVRKLYPKGTLLRISTAGVYIPFVFEGHIDAGLHPIQYPFTMAHEMSHGYGLADEGTCNFTGFVACMASDDSFVQYSASMSIWRYMANNLRKGSPTLYRKLMRHISPNVRTDLIAVMDEMDKYPDIMPKVRDAVYDTYLKSHGVAGGLSNYSKVVEMSMAWKRSGRDPDLIKKIYLIEN
ncbi:MAG: hypothetical protein ACJA1A_000296 [Saprospiraceae bacterium]